MAKERRAEVRNSPRDSSMELLSKAFGEYQTNCYICKFKQGEIVIDAGMGAEAWVRQTCQNPLAFLNTHGHFDHIWSNATLKNHFPNTPLIAPALDSFMLESDCFELGLTPSKADMLIECAKATHSFKIANINITFSHFPGHTPGCSIIEIDNAIFSGDFIFHRSIGRSDFPYSSNDDMLESLMRFEGLDSSDKPIYPGHGIATSLKSEQHNVHFWIKHLRHELANKS